MRVRGSCLPGSADANDTDFFCVEGPVVAYHEDGSVFLKDLLAADEWIGTHRVFTSKGDALLPIDLNDPVFTTVPVEFMGPELQPNSLGLAQADIDKEVKPPLAFVRSIATRILPLASYEIRNLRFSGMALPRDRDTLATPLLGCCVVASAAA